ncbi:RNA-binding protein 4.1-like [Megalops cyprinoides]|uniref:RNA-binding protein 4.1-like n=1 Tax=Megalops cyprinoides TaxID=118141 RepID=UPI0018647F6A|nr:RNA-binding protein 4.1-like [Megalops cyprinoides]XP_036404049.1 RNA-binding protein 4.1-like [Megalops cyprinoides]
MVKIFIGNLSQDTTAEELRSLFSQYGKVSECDVLKRYGFVHMDNKTEADEAIRSLHHHVLNGLAMNVELSRGKPKASTKLHVSNINPNCTNQELRSKFEEYGPVVECDIVKDYAFVHMERADDAMEAISGLDNTAFQGKLMSVQLSTSRLRTVPGMGDQTGCYVCGKQGHWSKDCHLSQNGSYGSGGSFTGGFRGSRGFPLGGPGFGRGGSGFPGVRGMSRGPGSDFAGGPAYGPAAGYFGGVPSPVYGPSREYGSEMEQRYNRAAGPYAERVSAFERERCGGVDFYEKFRARPFASGYGEERHLSLPAPSLPSSTTFSREYLPSSTLSSYERRPLPPPTASGSSYYSRDRSPIRRSSQTGEGYSYERSRLSPVSSLSRSSTYDVPRAKDPYAERTRYAY